MGIDDRHGEFYISGDPSSVPPKMRRLLWPEAFTRAFSLIVTAPVVGLILLASMMISGSILLGERIQKWKAGSSRK